MKQLQQTVFEEEWIRMLGKGMITIPKGWREEFDLKKGEMLRAKKEKERIILQPAQKAVPYRIYTQTKLKEFLKEDRLLDVLAEKIEKRLSKDK